MSFIAWMGLAGSLFLTLALSSASLRRLPISTSSIYLALGLVLGPIGFGLLRIDPVASAPWLERLTEVAVIVSLFVSGLKMRLRWRSRRWRVALRMAGPLMLVCIAGVTGFAHLVLGLELGLAMLVGAILAPTDPVLASAVSVSNASDRDRVRHGLTGEAGLNDGMAFPFVVLALSWLDHERAGAWLVHWAAYRLLWAVPAGLLLGYALGHGAGRLAIMLRARHQDTAAPSDFLALALIALSYVGAHLLGAWGFLAVFAAGVGLRRAEWAVVQETPHPSSPRSTETARHPPAEELVIAKPGAAALREPAVAAGALLAQTISFGDALERLLEILLVVIVGASLSDSWDWRAVAIAGVLMIALRPAATYAVLVGTPTTRAQRALLGWFGIRGIGSLYYLCYAVNHGIRGDGAQFASSVTISIVAISVLVHGVCSKPLLVRYERALQAADGGPQALPPRRQR